MLQYLLMCKSLTYAQKVSRELERNGITAIVTRSPVSSTQGACNYSVKISEIKLTRALAVLKDARLDPVRVLLLLKDGSVSEV